jgi:Holliday junction resolvase RusA-like endonuclease
MAGRPPLDSVITLSATFTFARPKSHYWTGKRAGVLRPDAANYHTGRPDTSNLVKLIEDALNGVVWSDDSRVAVYNRIEKVYGDTPSVTIKIEGA